MKIHEIISERAEVANFDRWFKQSVVVDQHGRPMVMYHGTFRNFDAFFPGSHFGDKDTANTRWHNVRTHEPDRFAGNHGIIYPVFLSIQNPLRVVDDKGLSDGYDLCRAALKVGAITPDEDKACQDTISPGIAKRRLFILLAQRGYDGLVYLNVVEGNTDSFVPFRSNQVKSIFNSGLYSDSDHMREGLSGD